MYVLQPLFFDGFLQYHYWLEMEGVSAVPELVGESHESMSTDQSSRLSKKRAKVWEHIESEVVDGIEKALCKYCRTQLSLVFGNVFEAPRRGAAPDPRHNA